MSEHWSQWVRDDDGRWRCPKHPHVYAAGTSHTTSGQPIDACGECWRSLHVCALPDDIEWPEYWIDCSNAFAAEWYRRNEMTPPVFACAFHGRGYLWPFTASEACRRCIEEDDVQ